VRPSDPARPAVGAPGHFVPSLSGRRIAILERAGGHRISCPVRRRRSAVCFKEDTLKDIKSSIGLLKVWIDQSHDRGYLENQKTKKYEGALNGVCHAVVNDWLGRKLPYLGHGFETYFRMGIPDEIFAIQCAMTDGLRNTKQLLVRELSQAKSMSEHAKSLSAKAIDATVDLRGERIADLKKRMKELTLSRLKVFDLDGMKLVVEGKALTSLEDVWKAVAGDGYYQVHFGTDEGDAGHAVGLCFDKTEIKAELLDPNTGLIEFATRGLLAQFFEKFWDRYYKGKFDLFWVASYQAQRGVDYQKN
jgi:hypothetical protein